MALTDPKYVYLTADTAHLTLGGGDALQIIRDYYPRLAEVHMKDTYPRYRGNIRTPTQAEHAKASLYHNLGAGGVDFPAIFKLLRDRKFKGWVVYDLDAPRPGDGTGSIRRKSRCQHQLSEKRTARETPATAAARLTLHLHGRSGHEWRG